MSGSLSVSIPDLSAQLGQATGYLTSALSDGASQLTNAIQNLDLPAGLTDNLGSLGTTLSGLSGSLTDSISGSLSSLVDPTTLSQMTAGFGNSLSTLSTSLSGGITDTLTSLTGGINLGDLGDQLSGVTGQITGALSGVLPNGFGPLSLPDFSSTISSLSGTLGDLNLGGLTAQLNTAVSGSLGSALSAFNLSGLTEQIPGILSSVQGQATSLLSGFNLGSIGGQLGSVASQVSAMIPTGLLPAATALGLPGLGGIISNPVSGSGLRAILIPASDQSGNPANNSSGQQTYQALDGFITIEEGGHDELEITDHPVEQGSVISDHAYLLPCQLRMRIAWSAAMSAQAGSIQALGSTLSTLAGSFGNFETAGDSFLSSVYIDLLVVQAAREPLMVLTGQRTYQSMLVRSVDKQTTQELENSLVLDIMFREIILVSTSTVTIPQSMSSNPSNLSSPQKAAPTQNVGQQQLQPGSSYNGNWQ